MSKRRPIIGVTAGADTQRITRWANCLAIWRAGGRPRIVTPDRPAEAAHIDGLLVGGGIDLDAGLYGGEMHLAEKIDPSRDALEMRLVGDATAAGLPVLGVCRGAQIINVQRGGTLHGDIHARFNDVPKLRTPLPLKRVEILADSRLAGLLGTVRCRVNSLHHQSVDQLGRGLRIVARDKWGIVQAIERPHGPFLVGVQWHPEYLVFDRGQQNLYRQLVAAARMHALRPEDAGSERKAELALPAG